MLIDTESGKKRLVPVHLVTALLKNTTALTYLPDSAFCSARDGHHCCRFDHMGR